MIIDILYTVTGIILLYAGAELLVRGSTSLSYKLNVPPLLIGLIVIGFGTSSPELVVSIDAALAGSGEIAVGNIIGSNISNIALILGIGALIFPIRVQKSLMSLEIPVLVISSILVTFLIFNGFLSRFNGVILCFGLLSYLVVTIRSNYFPSFKNDETVDSVGKIRYMILRIVGGLTMLIFGAELMVNGSLGLARAFEISEAVIGLTVVAAGTSLPELATAIIASIRKKGDLILGGLIGSNILNILFVLGITAIIHPISLVDITRTDLLLMTILAIFMIPVMWTGFRVSRWEGGVLLLIYIGYIVYLFVR